MKRLLSAMSMGLALAAAPVFAADAPAGDAPAGDTKPYAAKEYTCKNSANVRKVKLDFGDASTGKDCKVSYLKVTEGNSEKVLWNSQKDGKYCQEHASGFVEKLKGAGWTCE